MVVTRLGGNQSGIGEYNEKVVLFHIRHGKLTTKAEIARHSGLTAQTVSVIVNRLLKRGLIKSADSPIKKKKQVGFPAKVLSLNPSASYSIGISICRRALSISLVNFSCEIEKQLTVSFDFPDPMFCLDFIESNLKKMLLALTDTERSHLIGIGISAPYGLGDRPELTRSRGTDADNWKKINLKAFVESLTPLPVYFEHDVKPACLADLTLTSKTDRPPSYLYIFVGTILGGALVIENELFKGRFGYAGALGPMLTGKSENNQLRPVLDFASTSLIEETLSFLDNQGLSDYLSHNQSDGTQNRNQVIYEDLQNWLGIASRHLAILIINSCSVIDFETAVIDGDLPKPLIEELTTRTKAELDQFDFTGLIKPKVDLGSLGHDSYALGASFLPIHAKYEPAHTEFFSQTELK